ncbi:hypothetical protein BDV24DRAFT_136186 [Aspergillus arachidicola]|uniref:Uncharacterized protein n=1 Tax=Aspergillus arachidicola TaxID=656916 RepID=A0A5N6Y4G1_9EURO|nr:hypothetical protein BDV24DRAFT_136186 [Aspergillus arachidicola]
MVLSFVPPTQSSRLLFAQRMCILGLCVPSVRPRSVCPACKAGAIPVPPAIKRICWVSTGISHSICGPRISMRVPMSRPCKYRDISPKGSLRMKNRSDSSSSTDVGGRGV